MVPGRAPDAGSGARASRDSSPGLAHERLPRVAEGQEVAPPAVLAGRGLEPARADRREPCPHAIADGLGVLDGERHLVARGEVQVGERQLVGPLAPYVDAGERVDVELDP